MCIDGLWRTRVENIDNMREIIKYYSHRHIRNIILYCKIKSQHTSPELREISWNARGKVTRNVVDGIHPDQHRQSRQIAIHIPEDIFAEAYRKHVIYPAIASVHPSRIESLASLCEVREVSRVRLGYTTIN